MRFHLLDNIHVIFYQQHVINIQHYINEVITNLLGIYTVISPASHKSQFKDVCVKLLVLLATEVTPGLLAGA